MTKSAVRYTQLTAYSAVLCASTTYWDVTFSSVALWTSRSSLSSSASLSGSGDSDLVLLGGLGREGGILFGLAESRGLEKERRIPRSGG